MAPVMSEPTSVGHLIAQSVQYGEWIIPTLLLYVVAWARFNSPPTNRSGTTFALFFLGAVFYYALIIALWLLVTIAISQGSIGLDRFGALLRFKPGAEGEMDQYKPIFAALIIVVASQFPMVHRIDKAARAFCISLAAIPRQADRIAVELAQSDFFPRSERLRDQIAKIVSESVGKQALNFASDSSIASRYTRAVGLYCMFVAPKNGSARLEFPAGTHARSAYAAIMQLAEAIASRAQDRYDELVQLGMTYFSSSEPTKDDKDTLNRAITDVSNLVCSLIARFVLYCDRTGFGRRQRISNMGFDTTHPMPSFGLDQWAVTILAVMGLSIAIMTLMPGTKPIGGTQVLSIAITFALSIGFAVMGSILVAQRFIERRENTGVSFPPMAELVLAGLIVAGISIALRIGIPLIPALLSGNGSGLDNIILQFTQRWPGIIIPATCTISLGLLCAYLGSLDWNWLRIVVIAAVGNGVAFLVAGLAVGFLIDESVLSQFYVDPSRAPWIVGMNTGLMGALIGAMVLSAFRKSERVRKDVAERVANSPHALPEMDAPALVGDLDIPSRSEALQILGGYSRGNVRELEGKYLCFRPAFSTDDVINAYVVVLRWDALESCLTFEEQQRVDSGHTQRGRVYIPDGKPFISLVTVERGAVRMIMLSRPDGDTARGLITTLSNPSGMQFTPVSSPVVLKRVEGSLPQLGLIRPGMTDYVFYQKELETVMPAYGFFATGPKCFSRDQTHVGLSLVK